MSLIKAQERRIRRLNLTRRVTQAVLWLKSYILLLITACFLAERFPLWLTIEFMIPATIIESMAITLAIEFVNCIYYKTLGTENLELRRLTDRHNRLTGGQE